MVGRRNISWMISECMKPDRASKFEALSQIFQFSKHIVLSLNILFILADSANNPDEMSRSVTFYLGLQCGVWLSYHEILDMTHIFSLYIFADVFATAIICNGLFNALCYMFGDTLTYRPRTSNELSDAHLPFTLSCSNLDCQPSHVI